MMERKWKKTPFLLGLWWVMVDCWTFIELTHGFDQQTSLKLPWGHPPWVIAGGKNAHPWGSSNLSVPPAMPWPAKMSGRSWKSAATRTLRVMLGRKIMPMSSRVGVIKQGWLRNPPRIWRFSYFFICDFMCFHVKIIRKWGIVQPAALYLISGCSEG